MKTKTIIFLIAATVSQRLISPAQALQPEVLYEFQQAPSYPEARLVEGNDGSFYGTTSSGGSGGAGTVFKVDTSGVLTTLVSFDGTNGAQPRAALVLGSDGNFYGTTGLGGTGYADWWNGFGTVFRLATNGVLTTLVSFDGTNGARPEGLVVGDNGNFYGTTFYGGGKDYGMVFRMSGNGELTTLASFSGTNGANPNGLVLGSDGNIYGTTQNGGSLNWGTVFKLSTNGELTALVSFTVSNGNSPNGLVPGNDGNFYGAIGGGTSHLGTVFKITPGGLLTTLASFNGTNGANPNGLVLGSDGNIYGTTESGGTQNGGTVFRVSTNGVLTTLASFDRSDGGIVSASALALGSDGNFYGTTQQGGSSRLGTIFRVTTNGVLTTLASFGDLGGSAPDSLVLGQDGNLYGTTAGGGSSNYGTVFKLSTNRVFTVLASFIGTGGGARSPLLLGADGYFYGANERDTVFKINPDGQLTTLASLTNNNTEENVSSLVIGNDGALYGTSVFEGGNWDYGGTVFRLTTNGDLTTLVTFNGTNGAVPNGLVFGVDGNLYGMAAGEMGDHPSQGTSTVFKVTTAGDLTTLASYAWNTYDWTVWTNPPLWGEKLVLGKDGNLYGATANGGSTGYGTVFKLTTNGMVTTLVSFNGTNGADPCPALVLDGGGNFYGTTAGGGSNDSGTVFQMTSEGVLTTLASFNSTNGAYPDGPLVFGNDGNLYGTTSGGGSGGGGTIFRIVLPRLKTLVREPGGSFLLTGAGPANDSYRLWASSDLSLSFAAWTLLAKGSFDSTGNFSFTDTLTNRSRFYRISVP